MRIIVSPAKQMAVDTDSFACAGLPQFLPQAQRLLDALRALTPQARQALWRCSDKIAAENEQRLRTADLRRGLTPALLAYQGIQYRTMAPGVFTDSQLAYVQRHLRILSGFYGLLRPLDGVAPYRLEMQAKLTVDGAKDLYAFWGSQIADALFAETDTVLDLGQQGVQPVHRPVPPGGRAHRRMPLCGGCGRQTGRKGHLLQDGPRRDGALPGRDRCPDSGTGPGL